MELVIAAICSNVLALGDFRRAELLVVVVEYKKSFSYDYIR